MGIHLWISVETTVVETVARMLTVEEVVNFLGAMAAKTEHNGILVQCFALDFVPVAAGGLHLNSQWTHHLSTDFRKQLSGGIAGGVGKSKASGQAIFIAQAIIA